MTRSFTAAAIVLCLASPGRAQNVAQYLTLAREYAAGQGGDAVARLSTWSRDDVEAAGVAAAVTASTRDLVAAAMLHTDLANSIIDADAAAGDFHLRKAQSALSVASARIGERERLSPFVRRWLRFVASVYTSCELLNQASDVVQVGLRRFPEDPGLYVARGIIVEVGVRKHLVPDWRRGAPFSGRARAAVEALLKQAASNYLRALAIDGHDAAAHLHLGWVRFVLEDGRAKDDFDAALVNARDETVRYLAHLFLGGLAERGRHLDEALLQYEGARSAGAGYQTPYVALSRVEDALGHGGRARELAQTAVRLQKSDDDPWWDHRIGLDRAGLVWLRRSEAAVTRLIAAALLAVQAAAPPQTTFRTGVEIVELDVSVTRGGVPVAGLTARDFALTDNGVLQQVQSVTLEKLPLSVTLVLDTSQSVAGDRLGRLVQAGEGLTAALRPGDRAALITFSHAVDLRVPMTADLSTVRAGLGRMTGTGATSLRDAVHLALQLQPHDLTRPLILLFTDGHDTASWLTEDAALDSARRAGVVVHVVRVESDAFLDKITQVSGGRMWSATSDRQLQELFSRALDEMRARYLLTYTPSGPRKAGWHELKVTLRVGSADITARRGYFVARQPPQG